MRQRCGYTGGHTIGQGVGAGRSTRPVHTAALSEGHTPMFGDENISRRRPKTSAMGVELGNREMVGDGLCIPGFYKTYASMRYNINYKYF